MKVQTGREAFFSWGTFDVTCCDLSGPAMDIFRFDTVGYLTTPQPGSPDYNYEEDPMYWENRGGGLAGPY